jgi:hypothetical protein
MVTELYLYYNYIFILRSYACGLWILQVWETVVSLERAAYLAVRVAHSR